ncbi:uncharacterized protein DMENIID0001_045890 [Sergentomyia squamirostris]
MFSSFSSMVIEYESSFEENQTSKFSQGTSTNPQSQKSDASSNTCSVHNVSVQTENSFCLPTKEDNEKKLGQWLKKILPLVEEELQMGISDCPSQVKKMECPDNPLKINLVDSVQMKVNNLSNEKLRKGAATWLSLATAGAPILAVSCIVDESEHNASDVVIFTPKRIDSRQPTITYIEHCTIPVKASIQILSTNPYDKNIFAGGSVSGDLYVWHQETHPNQQINVNELFCRGTHYGAIVDMAWLRFTFKDVILLTCHEDGIVESWKILPNMQVVHEKSLKIRNKSPSMQNASLKAIIPINDRCEFVLGTEDGRVILCSASQVSTIRGVKNAFDPVITDLESHQFAISSLHLIKQANRDLLASCDIAGHIFFHDVMTSKSSDPIVTYKIPLPFNSNIIIGKNLEFIIWPGKSGTLEIFTTSSGKKSLIEGNAKGKGTLIAGTNSSEWIVTGVYEGIYYIYRIAKD